MRATINFCIILRTQKNSMILLLVTKLGQINMCSTNVFFIQFSLFHWVDRPFIVRAKVSKYYCNYNEHIDGMRVYINRYSVCSLFESHNKSLFGEKRVWGSLALNYNVMIVLTNNIVFLRFVVFEEFCELPEYCFIRIVADASAFHCILVLINKMNN